MPPKKDNDENAEVAYLTGLSKAFNQPNDYRKTADGDIITSHAGVVDAGLDSYDDIWKVKPPSVTTFFGTFDSDPKDAWFYEPLYPIQQDFVEEMMGENPLVWNIKYDEGHAFWGKGGGKDRTIAKMLIYVIVKLLCMHNPQKGLEKYVGEGTLGHDCPIDIANVSKDQIQAKDVFFKNFKGILKNVRNPETGKNFFVEQGVDIREGHDVQTTNVQFPHNIACHSLNSKQYAGEGLTLFLVVADEIGASPTIKVRSQLTSIRETLDSRFPKVGKLMLLSFKYELNCAMSIEYKLGLKDKRVYSSKAATWEVNPKKHKKNYKRHYERNPEKAKMTFECEDPADAGGGYIKRTYIIPWNLTTEQNPFIGETITTNSILSVQFKEWFWNKIGTTPCAIHVDLAKGAVEEGQDCAGIAMSHPVLLNRRIHPKISSFLESMGFEISESDTKALKKGIVFDFYLQLTAPQGGEIPFADIITFIAGLKTKGVNVFKVTYDGWQSVGEIQRINNLGILADNLSVDRDTGPYDTLVDLLYLGLARGYFHPILFRELKELEKLENGKIDHPEMSWQRLEEEGYELGSKDVSDSVAGSCFTSIKEIPITSGIVF